MVYYQSSLSALEYLKISLQENNLNNLTRPNILFLDINMPECNGFEFLDKLSKIDNVETQNLKISLFLDGQTRQSCKSLLRVRML